MQTLLQDAALLFCLLLKWECQPPIRLYRYIDNFIICLEESDRYNENAAFRWNDGNFIQKVFS